MIFMPFASVVERTCSAPGTTVAGAGFAPAAPVLVAMPRISGEIIHTRLESARLRGKSGMRHLENESAQLYSLRPPKRKAPRTGEVVRGAKKRTPGKSCSQSYLRNPLAGGLPRNLDGLDRRELCPRESCIDGRETHAATATTPDQHSRHRRPHARDPLRVGKNQCHCRSRHHEGYKATHVPARPAEQNQGLGKGRGGWAPGHVTRSVS